MAIDEPGFALRLAAQNGDAPAIEYLLGKSPNLINDADENGWQALHEAIRGGYLEVSFFGRLSGNLSFVVLTLERLSST